LASSNRLESQRFSYFSQLCYQPKFVLITLLIQILY
jgi:hypothetical protein